MTVTALPNITEIILSMATSNDILNRTTTKETVVACGMEPLRADGVCTEDVIKLENWIGTLTDDQKLTLVDGEEDERATLVAESPTAEVGSKFEGFVVAQLLDDVYDALVAL